MLAEVLQKHARTLDDFDEEIDYALKTRLDYARLLTRLRGKKLTTERHYIQGASYRNRGEHQSF